MVCFQQKSLLFLAKNGPSKLLVLPKNVCSVEKKQLWQRVLMSARERCTTNNEVSEATWYMRNIMGGWEARKGKEKGTNK